ncbi:PA3496 family putative envelope integrity protein [Pseudomonas sp. Gutcm_11s]|uniref:PA3496 family putative envelope integrity protein n=1 Tax=Pseudomonas sp. Gutcm_11s TaxID=3026088 RepID=UPI002360E111|nr:transcriptional regulator [Pseudomonas sp. Gutcm_11s]MDD0842467.1 transcriptional regulator [Pseudomonas sp. Gutcm_11s]
MSLYLDEPVHDSKTRRKLEDQRRMAFRRAIEEYAEHRRLQQELGGYSEPLPASISRPRAA